MRRILFLLIIVPLFFSCSIKRNINNSLPENQDPLLLSVLWFQKSAEMQALYYQGYNIAKSSLSEKLVKSDNRQPKAVIMDIDECILDNSPFEAFQIIKNVPFSDSLWLVWVKKACAKPLPGVVDFVKYAETKGVEIFYVTNRKSPEESEPTLSNLLKMGFPFADSIHLILKTDVSSKEARRKAISEKYDILLLIGDNLADFDMVFDKRADDLGFGAVKDNMIKFGDRFIILPNPMYGPWINAAIKNAPGKSTREKLLNTIQSF
jgi:5'-nucleotidase (lipoprotein e(P4) family)